MALQSSQFVSIGELAERSGFAVSKIRYYETQGLLHAARSTGGTRFFRRADNRRLAFINIAQKFGYSLEEIRNLLAELPNDRTPTKRDWENITNVFQTKINTEIERLEFMRSKLDGCIGCGCLSVENCPLYNPDDEAATNGKGAVFLQNT